MPDASSHTPPTHEPPPRIDTSIPQSARVWNYLVGGKDYYPVDRAVAEEVLSLNPHVAEIAVATRGFLMRTLTHLTNDVGIRQFLDVGSGLPTADNTHRIVQTIAPECRVVYVDHDPLVLAHARALLVGTEEGSTDYIDADIRDPKQILEQAWRSLAPDRPVALVLMGILAHIVEDDVAYSLVRELMAGLPSGSHLIISDDTNVVHGEEMEAMVAQWNASGQNPRTNRTPERIAEFFDGLELLDPGVVPVSHWRPEELDVGRVTMVDDHGGVGRKP